MCNDYFQEKNCNGDFQLYIACFTDLWGEGHSAVGWGISGSIQQQTGGPKSVCSGNGWP